MKKQIIPFSNHEIVIEYQTPYSKGTMIMDLNFYTKYHKVIMRKLKHKGYRVVIYEPTLKEDTFEEYEVINDFDVFKEESDVILVNRQDEIISKAKTKVYTRDLFVRD